MARAADLTCRLTSLKVVLPERNYLGASLAILCYRPLGRLPKLKCTMQACMMRGSVVPQDRTEVGALAFLGTANKLRWC
jgi:hypothetical protein